MLLNCSKLCEVMIVIIRGTTQTHYFDFPFDPSNVGELSVVYSQNKEIKIRKSLSDVSFDEESLIVELSQEETFNFDKVGIPSIPSKSLVLIQIRAILNDGSVFVSSPIKDRVYDILDDEVMML